MFVLARHPQTGPVSSKATKTEHEIKTLETERATLTGDSQRCASS